MTRRTAFLIGLLVQLLCVFGLFLPSVILLTAGTPITLETAPVDPWSPLRGQYVTLGYQAAQGIDRPDRLTRRSFYVVLRDRGDGVYERAAVSTERPRLEPGQACVWAVDQGWQVQFPDLAQYFVEEGSGTEIEEASQSHRLLVDAVTDGRCRARIRGVRIGQELTEEDRRILQERFGFPEPPPAERPAEPRPLPAE